MNIYKKIDSIFWLIFSGCHNDYICIGVFRNNNIGTKFVTTNNYVGIMLYIKGFMNLGITFNVNIFKYCITVVKYTQIKV